MKTAIMKIVLATLVAATLAGPAAAQTAEDYWPKTQGNEWTYEIEGRIGGGTTFDLRIDRRSSGWAHFEGSFKGMGLADPEHEWLWMSTTDGRIWVWNNSTRRYSVVFNLGRQGQRFESDIDGGVCLDGVEYTIVEKGATVQTPVGSFSDAIVVAVSRTQCADAGMTRMVLVPGVGPVEWSWVTIAGPHTARLIAADVEGVEYRRQTASGGLRACLSIDEHEYQVIDNQMPVVPPGGRPLVPETMTVKLVITNQTAEDIVYRYGSGQTFECVIRDASGTEVYRWSHGRFFTMATWNRTLAAGDSLELSDTFELRYNAPNHASNGKAILEGEYTVEFSHRTLGGESAVLPVKVERMVVR